MADEDKEQSLSGTDERETELRARRALREMTATDEEAPVNLSLRSILGGDILAGSWFRRNIWFMLLLVGMMIFYVNNRYACQEALIEQTRLSDTLVDRRYKVLTCSSELKEKTRRGEVEENLRDTALGTSTTPLYRIELDE